MRDLSLPIRTRPMNLRFFGLAAGLAVTFCLTPSARAAEGAGPPNGFVALFNGKDLAGWHGMPHFDPYKLAAMPAEQRQQEIKKWTEDAGKHWTIRDGELISDGTGAYLTTDKEYGDIELWAEYNL